MPPISQAPGSAPLTPLTWSATPGAQWSSAIQASAPTRDVNSKIATSARLGTWMGRAASRSRRCCRRAALPTLQHCQRGPIGVCHSAPTCR